MKALITSVITDRLISADTGTARAASAASANTNASANAGAMNGRPVFLALAGAFCDALVFSCSIFRFVRNFWIDVMSDINHSTFGIV